MEFLYDKVYSNQYFALILFASIAILLILFIIVLLAAIRDAKKTKIAELDELEKEQIEEIQEHDLENEVPELNKDLQSDMIKESEGYEFFANEDEQSKTMDIVLDNPNTENSMSSLLNEFDSDNQSIEENSTTSIDELLATVSNDNDAEIKEEVNLNDSEVFFEDINLESKNADTGSDDMNLSELLNSSEEQDVVKPKEVFSSVYTEEDDFELPKEKHEEPASINLNENDVDDIDLPSTKVEEINPTNIDLESTGILDFSNVESESYDITK